MSRITRDIAELAAPARERSVRSGRWTWLRRFIPLWRKSVSLASSPKECLHNLKK
jgi:hypothetical protein